jgi:hypothetical protein
MENSTYSSGDIKPRDAERLGDLPVGQLLLRSDLEVGGSSTERGARVGRGLVTKPGRLLAKL